MSRQRAQQLASEFLACADPTGWFEVLYAEAGSNYAAVPWADLAQLQMRPNKPLHQNSV